MRACVCVCGEEGARLVNDSVCVCVLCVCVFTAPIDLCRDAALLSCAGTQHPLTCAGM